MSGESKFSSKSVVAVCRECKPTIDAFIAEIDRLEEARDHWKGRCENESAQLEYQQKKTRDLEQANWACKDMAERMANQVWVLAGSPRLYAGEHRHIGFGEQMPKRALAQEQPRIDWDAEIEAIGEKMKADLRQILAAKTATESKE